MTRPFEQLRVLDLSSRLSGAFVARLFGDFGADVVLVEPTEGHPLRHEPPFLDDEPGLDHSVLHAYANWNKRSTVATDQTALTELVASADIVITTTTDLASMVYRATLQDAPADVIHLSITPHGLDGPLAQTNGNHLTACARSGWAYINAYQDEPPLQLPTQQTGYVAGITGFVTAAAALYRRRRTGHGEQIDVSELEALALTCHPWGIAAIYEGRGWCRGSRQGGKPRGLPGPLWETKDGLMNFGFGDWHNWPEAMHLIGLPAFADAAHLIPDQGRHSQDLSGVINGAAKSVKSLSRWPLFHGLSKLRCISGCVQDMADIVDNEQLIARDFLVQTEIAGRPIRTAGAPAKLHPAAWALTRPAPRLNEHVGQIEAQARIPVAPSAESVQEPRQGPLSGVRVLTFTHAWSGTFGTELLALLGADVVQVEGRNRTDVWRNVSNVVPAAVANPAIPQHRLNTQGLYNSVNLHKRAITLDMTQARGQELFWQLVPRFDVIAENFAPHVMDKWGITLDTLQAVRPGIIFASISGYGRGGPYQWYPANGNTTEPMSGLASIHGYAGDSGMNTSGFYPDPISGYFFAASIMSALHAREQTGEAQRIDEAMLEALTVMVGDAVATYEATGRVPRPAGNRHPRLAPHGIYAAKDGEWMAVSAETEPAWQALAKHMGLAAAARFDTMAQRKAHEDALDDILSTWCKTQNAWAAESAINALGGCAARVVPLYELYTKPDPNLAARGFIVNIDHPETGVNLLPGRPWKLTHTEASPIRPAPCVGEHSREFLCEELGLSDADYRQLVQDGITGTLYD